MTETGTQRINYLHLQILHSQPIFSLSLWVYPTLFSVPNKYITIASFSSGGASKFNIFSAEIAIDSDAKFVVMFNDDEDENGQTHAKMVAAGMIFKM